MGVVPNLPKCPVPVLMCRAYLSVWYRYWCTEVTEVSGTGMKVCIGTGGTGIHIVPKLPKCPVPVLMSYRSYESVRYRYWCTEVTKVSGTGIDVVPKLPKCPVPVLMYRSYRSVRYRYWCRTELTEVSGTGIDVPVPVLMYRSYRSVRYRYCCLTEASGTGNTGGRHRRYASVRTVPNTSFLCCSKCTLWIIN